MNHDVRRFLAIFTTALAACVIFFNATIGCDSGSVTGARATSSACDTLRYAFNDSTWYVKVTCTRVDTVVVVDSVFVECEPDTAWMQPDWACVEDCVEINGLGHWRECLQACVPAQ